MARITASFYNDHGRNARYDDTKYPARASGRGLVDTGAASVGANWQALQSGGADSEAPSLSVGVRITSTVNVDVAIAPSSGDVTEAAVWTVQANEAFNVSCTVGDKVYVRGPQDV